jgi:hypothetical protein
LQKPDLSSEIQVFYTSNTESSPEEALNLTSNVLQGSEREDFSRASTAGTAGARVEVGVGLESRHGVDIASESRSAIAVSSAAVGLAVVGPAFAATKKRAKAARAPRGLRGGDVASLGRIAGFRGHAKEGLEASVSVGFCQKQWGESIRTGMSQYWEALGQRRQINDSTLGWWLQGVDCAEFGRRRIVEMGGVEETAKTPRTSK